MNWKKLILGITIVNLLGWAMIEVWSYRYANSNVAMGAAFMVFTQLIGYYIVAIGSRVKITPPKLDKYGPGNCPKHEWHPSKWDPTRSEMCICCGAERGKL